MKWWDEIPSPNAFITGSDAEHVRKGCKVFDDEGHLLGTMLITMRRHDEGFVAQKDRDYRCAIFIDGEVL